MTVCELRQALEQFAPNATVIYADGSDIRIVTKLVSADDSSTVMLFGNVMEE